MRKEFQFMIKIGSRHKLSRECSLCCRWACDYDHHIILHCEGVLEKRDLFFTQLIDNLDVETYIALEMLDEYVMLALFLGGNMFIPGIDQFSYLYILSEFAHYLYSLKNILKNVY